MSISEISEGQGLCANHYIHIYNVQSKLRGWNSTCVKTISVHRCIFIAATPRLLFTLGSPYIRRVDLDGRRVINLYTGGVPRAIDFDYRYKQYTIVCQCWLLLLCTGETKCIGLMTTATESIEPTWMALTAELLSTPISHVQVCYSWY